MRAPLSYFLTLLITVNFFSCSDSGHYDIIIKNGSVIDGSGTHGMKTDIAIDGDKIIKLTNLSSATADKVIDATDRIVAPGFVDIHAHLEPIFELNTCESHLRQGITTALGGPDGRGPVPFGEYVDSLAAVGVGMNCLLYTSDAADD